MSSTDDEVLASERTLGKAALALGIAAALPAAMLALASLFGVAHLEPVGGLLLFVIVLGTVAALLGAWIVRRSGKVGAKPIGDLPIRAVIGAGTLSALANLVFVVGRPTGHNVFQFLGSTACTIGFLFVLRLRKRSRSRPSTLGTAER